MVSLTKLSAVRGRNHVTIKGDKNTSLSKYPATNTAPSSKLIIRRKEEQRENPSTISIMWNP